MLAWGNCCEAETTNQREAGDRMIGWGLNARSIISGLRFPFEFMVRGWAKHPCLAARPTKDGRPYPRQLCRDAVPTLPKQKGRLGEPSLPSPDTLYSILHTLSAASPRQIFSSDQGLRSSRESIAVAPASSMNLPAAPSNLSLRPVKTAALPRWPMVVV